MSYYPPSAGFSVPSQQPYPFGGAVYDPLTSLSGYPPPQANVSMPEPFSGGFAPSYPVPGSSASSLPYPPQPQAGGYMGVPSAPGVVSQPPVAMPSYESALMGSGPSYPPQPSYAPQSSYPPQPSYAPQSSYPPQPSYAPQSSYPPQPSYAPQSSYPPQPSYPPQASYPPAFSSPASAYPPASGLGAASYGAPGASMGTYPAANAPPSYPTNPSFPPMAAPCAAVPCAFPATSALPVGTSLVQGHGTVRPSAMFNAEEDSKVLRKAMKGFGTDERAIIDLLSRRANSQRQQIKLIYKTMYGRDLISDLSSELSFRFKQAVLALMMIPAEYDADQLNKAIRYLGTDEETLVEILCTRTNQQMNEIKAAYKRMYSRELERDLIGDTSGHFRRLVVALSTGGRREDGYVDIQRARADAMELYQAGERRWGTDESKFNQILCSQSHAQLRLVFEEYKRVAHRSIEQSIRSEMSGDLQMGMLAIVSVVQNPRRYLAERLYRSMKGLGTNDDVLIRVIVSRSEVDLVEIKHEFQQTYGQTLEAFITDDTSGDYKKTLLAIVRGC